MADKIMFLINLDPPIYNELATALCQDDNWKKLIAYLPKQPDEVYNLISSSDNTSGSNLSFVRKFLHRLNVTVEQLMMCLDKAGMHDVQDVLKLDGNSFLYLYAMWNFE